MVELLLTNSSFCLIISLGLDTYELPGKMAEKAAMSSSPGHQFITEYRIPYTVFGIQYGIPLPTIKGEEPAFSGLSQAP